MPCSGSPRTSPAAASSPRSVDERTIARYLPEPDMPDVDLFVRSSGEQRTSNFLLWQSAYAEMVFQDRLWPDYDRRDLWAAIQAYVDRERRYGGAVDAPTARGPRRRCRPIASPAWHDRLVELFPEVARVAADLIRHREVGAGAGPTRARAPGCRSAGCANHLAGQAANVVRLLAAPPSDEAADPCARALPPGRAGCTPGLDDEAQRRRAHLRRRLRGRPAPADLLGALWTPTSAALPGRARAGARRQARPRHGAHPRGRAGRSPSGRLPADPHDGGRSSHSDDLAASIGVDTPHASPTRRRVPCSACSQSVAAERHGQAARCCGREPCSAARAAGPVARPPNGVRPCELSRARPSSAAHRPSISTVCRTCGEAVGGGDRLGPALHGIPGHLDRRPHERHTTWWWWSVEHER